MGGVECALVEWSGAGHVSYASGGAPHLAGLGWPCCVEWSGLRCGWVVWWGVVLHCAVSCSVVWCGAGPGAGLGWVGRVWGWARAGLGRCWVRSVQQHGVVQCGAAQRNVV